jgi:hypothetical protein
MCTAEPGAVDLNSLDPETDPIFQVNTDSDLIEIKDKKKWPKTGKIQQNLCDLLMKNGF